MRRNMGLAVGAAVLSVAVAGVVLAPGDPEPIPFAGHGATCGDGLDNDRDGYADGTDPNDCFPFQEPGSGRPPDHDENSGPEQD